MKLLVITQKVDINDPILGFFHRWVIEFSKHSEKITVICLEKGEYDLSDNVKVLSLGKEQSFSRIKYLVNFYKYIWQERKNYDAVFVHMNQEYILLAGLWWRLVGKKVYMWRNHHAGSWLTDLASLFCTKVFCTSKYSYTAKYKKTVLMPVGIDTEVFKRDESVTKIPNSILFLSRISPVKKPHLLIEALKILKAKGVDFTASFYGDPIPNDIGYYEGLKKMVVDFGLSDQVDFHSGVPNHQTPAVYRRHAIFVNLSSNGMYDKTIFEALACGCQILVSNDNLRGQIADDFLLQQEDVGELSEKLERLLIINPQMQKAKAFNFQSVVAKNNLIYLGNKLFTIIK